MKMTRLSRIPRPCAVLFMLVTVSACSSTTLRDDRHSIGSELFDSNRAFIANLVEASRPERVLQLTISYSTGAVEARDRWIEDGKLKCVIQDTRGSVNIVEERILYETRDEEIISIYRHLRRMIEAASADRWLGESPRSVGLEKWLVLDKNTTINMGRGIRVPAAKSWLSIGATESVGVEVVHYDLASSDFSEVSILDVALGALDGAALGLRDNNSKAASEVGHSPACDWEQ